MYEEEREKKEYVCEVLRKSESIEIRFYDQIDIFNILLCTIEEREYYRMKEAQGIKVDYFVFQKKLVEMLERVAANALILSIVQRRAFILERSDFRNIVQVELPLAPIPEEQLRVHISEIVGEMQMSSTQNQRECMLLREESKRKEQAYIQKISSLEERIDRLAQEHRETETREKDINFKYSSEKTDRKLLKSELERYKSLYEKISEDAERNAERVAKAAENDKLLREKEKICHTLEEDLRKANEIIRRSFEEIKERKKAEAALKEQIEDIRQQKEEIASRNTQIEVELVEKKEEVKALEDMERERKEVVESLKAMNRSLGKKLESAYRVYSRIYGRPEQKAADDSESTKTEETATSSSLIAPESINY